MKKYLELLQQGKTLDRSQAKAAMDVIFQQGVPPEQVAAFLACLRMRGETTPELSGFLDSILARSLGFSPKIENAIDVCGTGGDGSDTFNISTVAALVLAGGGVRVAKHGNRAVSSVCGSADVLRAIGVAVDGSPDQFREFLDTACFGFLFANQYHPHLAAVAPVRKALGIRTTFNILGPLLNPARVQRQVIGVFDPSLCELIARTLLDQGGEEALVVSGEGGLDEFSISGKTFVSHLKNGAISNYEVTPESVGLTRGDQSELQGGGVEKNAEILLRILRGERKGAALDVVLLNAGAGFLVSGKVSKLAEGVTLAREAVVSGAAWNNLEQIRRLSRAILPRS